MEFDAQSLILGHLDPGERLLWSGRPRSGLVLRPTDSLAIPFSLMWAGFMVFWEYSVLSSGKAPLFFALWGVPFLVIGIHLTIGRFVVDAKQRANTAYGVTDQRIVIVSGIFNRKVKSLNIRTLSDMSLDERANGFGTISFGPSTPFSWWYSGTGWPGMPPPAPTFELIPDAKAVYEVVRKAQGSAT